ncbi:MAG TPA: hypothetical protein VGA17_06300 [Nitrospiraceae bacterium]
MLDSEIQRPGYTMRLWIDYQGRHRIFLNGQQVADKLVWGAKGEHVFQHAINGRLISFTIILKVIGLTTCRCQILENGTEVHRSEHRLSLNPKMGNLFRSWIPSVPRWTWIFIASCLLIPLVTIGGALPTVIGFAGAWGCSALASNTRWPSAMRIMLCLLVTIASWIGLAVVLIVLTSA